MDDLFTMYEFRFVDKKSKLGAVIYARNEEIAVNIINMWNEFQDIYHFIKKRFGFKKKFYTLTAPYELEQAQIDGILEKKEYYLKNHLK